MKVIIVDDHPLVKKGVEMVAALEEDIDIVGYAANGKEALELFEKVQPEVALVDLRLPGEYGLDIIKSTRAIANHCKYIVLTSYATEEDIRRAMEEEVDGYILKEALPEELISAIRMVAKGRKYYDPVVIQYAMERNDAREEKNMDRLTRRELEVLSALAKGMNNKTIAQTLIISEHTVKKHIGQILEKLSLQDRTQAALYAVSKGLHKEEL